MTSIRERAVRFVSILMAPRSSEQTARSRCVWHGLGRGGAIDASCNEAFALRIVTLVGLVGLVALLALLPDSARAQQSASDSRAISYRSTREVSLRQGPGYQYRRLVMLHFGDHVQRIGRMGEWARVETPAGAVGWVSLQYLEEQAPPAAPAHSAATASTSTHPSAERTAATAPTRNTAAAAAAQTRPSRPPSTDPLAEAKADVMEHAQPGSAASSSDGLKMVLFLIPVLAVTMLDIRGLKAFQQRTGFRVGGQPQSPTHGRRTPAFPLNAFGLTPARSEGTRIKVLESMPLGTATLHLVEVRGRMLLLGASGQSVATLLDLSQDDAERAREFRSILNSETAALETDDIDDTPVAGTAAVLDERLREAREAIIRAATSGRPRAWNPHDQNAQA